MEKDIGHRKLIEDLMEILEEARNFEFDDFKNKKYTAPKSALLIKLQKVTSNVVRGTYDQVGPRANGSTV